MCIRDSSTSGRTRRNIWKSRSAAKPARRVSYWRRDLRQLLDDRRALPPEPKPESKRRRGVVRRIIRIRPVIVGPRVIMRPVIRAIGVAIVPIVPPRADIGRLRLLRSGLHGG